MNDYDDDDDDHNDNDDFASLREQMNSVRDVHDQLKTLMNVAVFICVCDG